MGTVAVAAAFVAVAGGQVDNGLLFRAAFDGSLIDVTSDAGALAVTIDPATEACVVRVE
ncbi:MAG TPA: hypothetical protein PLD23_11290 [Armatimonadota bacterium]|nr:hypothetical protein [Armatimonadota bacterium]HQK94083.1 hypothetical protein [Armatimonadota bacterium]